MALLEPTRVIVTWRDSGMALHDGTWKTAEAAIEGHDDPSRGLVSTLGWLIASDELHLHVAQSVDLYNGLVLNVQEIDQDAVISVMDIVTTAGFRLPEVLGK